MVSCLIKYWYFCRNSLLLLKITSSIFLTRLRRIRLSGVRRAAESLARRLDMIGHPTLSPGRILSQLGWQIDRRGHQRAISTQLQRKEAGPRFSQQAAQGENILASWTVTSRILTSTRTRPHLIRLGLEAQRVPPNSLHFLLTEEARVTRLL